MIHNYLWPHHSYLQTDLLSCPVEASWTLDGHSGEKRFVSKWFLRNISLPINCTLLAIETTATLRYVLLRQ